MWRFAVDGTEGRRGKTPAVDRGAVRNRSGLLERVLGSVLRAAAPVAEHLEVSVSDGSDDDGPDRWCSVSWPSGGPVPQRNRPALGLVENMNRALDLSSGDWAMQLDDDDYLLPGAGGHGRRDSLYAEH